MENIVEKTWRCPECDGRVVAITRVAYPLDENQRTIATEGDERGLDCLECEECGAPLAYSEIEWR